MTSPQTSAVVVNYRTKELTADAVRSVLGEPDVREVLVVDNDSGDGSAEYLREQLPAQRCRILESGSNLGFGRAANLAAQQATAPVLLILNSDATLVPGSLRLLVQTLTADDATGVVAPAIYNADGRTLQPGAFGRFPRPFDIQWSRTRSGRPSDSPDWVSGVAMLLRRDDFLGLGGFDPDFEMYLEDIDLCRRIRQTGKVVRRNTRAGVVHLGGRSWRSSAQRRACFQTSKILYFEKQGATPAQVAYMRALKAVRVAAARLNRSRAGTVAVAGEDG